MVTHMIDTNLPSHCKIHNFLSIMVNILVYFVDCFLLLVCNSYIIMYLWMMYLVNVNNLLLAITTTDVRCILSMDNGSCQCK